ncbi:DUF2264 domain-containing protein [Glycomyces algeriensis]|uniref:DUF2264 domain-containing protein n=1 Tax=Glycomyces algeriensis TaxID=256037 RepID=A0A9W6G8K8_9ACTN|nr:DUF2264 domain-containing protein [Glycomyces algeriensis]MDA1364521.1 DUF2264 domain-containing protein [Glycomyces algeriensis]MDR7350556.1 hypothetical protein [Glycomyces algeriensis]GLI43265.1 hypothetical protein GALLR39Z86_31150 [Glycomyces algeriensis]
MTSPLRAFGPLEPTFTGWREAAAALGRPAVDLAARGPDAMPVTMSNHSHEENWFELLTRPLWGLAPAKDAVPRDLWHTLAGTLARALDPADDWYIGDAGPRNQRCVESAAVGWGLVLAPELLWDPLAPKAKDKVAAWLSQAYETEVIDSNWRFFPVLAGHGLDAVGVERDPAIADAHLKRLGEFYLGDGVFEDGPGNRVDYYNPFAFHTYGLLHYRISGDDRFVAPAAAFAGRFRSWFAADGAAVPYGRSLGYRFAQGSLWGALAAADVEAVPWAEAAGFSRRHLQWWWDKPILEPDGRLSVGYGYPNDALVEQYLTAGSPWWATKVFTGLLAGPAHPFWTAEAALPGPLSEPHPPARAVHVRDTGGHVTRLNGQAWRPMMRGGKDTYGRLAYSSLAGFSHSVDGPGLEAAAPDGALVFSEDGRHWRGREDSDDGVVRADGTVVITWRPWGDVTVTTTLEGARDGWHSRTHEIATARRLHTGEGGWCVPQRGHEAAVANDRIAVVSQGIRSELVDDGANRCAGLIAPMPGTHLYWPATVLPVLTGVLEPGRHVLRARIFAGND